MIVLYILLALILLFLAICYGIYRFAFHSPNKTQNDDFCISPSEQTDPLRETIFGMIRALDGIPYERVIVTSFDGLRLNGRFYHRKDGAPLVILFHGYRGTPSRDFSGGAQNYLEDGFNVLLIEQRAHCSSEGHVTTFAVREHRDCLTWIDYARARFGTQTPIILCGISMGASTVLTVSGLKLADNVKGIIADSPFTSPKEIIIRVSRDRRLPPHIVWWLAWLGACLFGRFRPTGVNTVESVKNTEVPILLIHGEDDRYVPCDMGRRIAAANPGMVELHTFPKAGHGLSFLIDRPRYEQITRAFLKRVLSQNGG